MKYLLLLILVFFCEHMSAQKVLFTDTSNKWSMLETGFDGMSSKSYFKYEGDTILYGKRYSVSTQGFRFIREDTTAGKIYFLRDSVERVFFDYNLRQNDTFSMEATTPYDTITLKHVVQSVDSVQLNNIYHKVWRLKCVTQTSFFQCQNYTFIEGIGTTSGPMFNLFPLVFEDCTQLRCFSTKGIYPSCVPAVNLPCALGFGWFYPYNSAYIFDNTTSCNYALSVEDIATTSGPVVFPNPGNRNTILKVPAQQTKVLLQVSDLKGCIVLEKELNGGETFPFYPYIQQSGLYLYKLQNKNTGQYWVGKFSY